MATARECRVLSNPTVYLDGRKIKIIPNSCKAELPDEIKTRAVSAGGGAIDVVHGLDVEQAYCKVTFDLANTAENVDLVQDYKARGRTFLLSTLRLAEDTVQLSYDHMLLSNKVEIGFESEGNISVEFTGRYAGV